MNDLKYELFKMMYNTLHIQPNQINELGNVMLEKLKARTSYKSEYSTLVNWKEDLEKRKDESPTKFSARFYDDKDMISIEDRDFLGIPYIGGTAQFILDFHECCDMLIATIEKFISKGEMNDDNPFIKIDSVNNIIKFLGKQAHLTGLLIELTKNIGKDYNYIDEERSFKYIAEVIENNVIIVDRYGKEKTMKSANVKNRFNYASETYKKAYNSKEKMEILSEFEKLYYLLSKTS